MNLNFTDEINRLMLGTLLAFLGIGLAATYWAVIGADDILNREDNPRLVEAEAAIRRGSIYDRHDTLLADSQVNEAGIVVRRYHHEAMNSVLGYFSLRYGVGGAEAAYNAILRGDTLPQNLGTLFREDVLHHPQMGSDVRLTLDLDLQQAAADVLANHQGAIVMMGLPHGDVLAVVSQPTFDPNTLDENWDNLVDAPDNPFFNRALQGRYQPGGIWQTPLMATAILSGYPINQPSEDAMTPVPVGDVLLACVIAPPQPALTMAEAYTYGCPNPFYQWLQQAGDAALQDIIDTFQLDSPPQLQSFISEIPPATAAQATLAPPSTPQAVSLQENLLGQGALTTSPLNMATMVAAVINGGNAPRPYVLQSTRAPQGDWDAARAPAPTTPYMTATTARRLRELMIQTMRIVSARQDDVPMGGHVALAYSGDAVQTWFVGFATADDNQGVVVALILEDTDDPMLAAQLGQHLLERAIQVPTG